jgi:hypothetical protein
MSIQMMPGAGSHRCRYASAGELGLDDERIALVDGELGYASSSLPVRQAVRDACSRRSTTRAERRHALGGAVAEELHDTKAADLP